MNIFELIIFLLMIAVGWIVARELYPIGGLWFAIPGFIAGVAFIPSFFFGHSRYRQWAYCGDKWMPNCTCGSSEFSYRKVGEEYQLLCKQCDKGYEKIRSEVWIFENGVKKPYRRLVKRRGWI